MSNYPSGKTVSSYLCLAGAKLTFLIGNLNCQRQNRKCQFLSRKQTEFLAFQTQVYLSKNMFSESEWLYLNPGAEYGGTIFSQTYIFNFSLIDQDMATLTQKAYFLGSYTCA